MPRKKPETRKYYGRNMRKRSRKIASYFPDIFDIDQLLGRVGGSGDSKQPCTGSDAIKEEATVGWGTSNNAATVAAATALNLDNHIPEFDDSFFSELFPDLDVDSAVAF